MPTMCSDKPGACFVICDHCSHFDFNGDKSGCYTGEGYCRFHKRPADPCEGCNDYLCFTLKPRPAAE